MAKNQTQSHDYASVLAKFLKEPNEHSSPFPSPTQVGPKSLHGRVDEYYTFMFYDELESSEGNSAKLDGNLAVSEDDKAIIEEWRNKFAHSDLVHCESFYNMKENELYPFSSFAISDLVAPREENVRKRAFELFESLQKLKDASLMGMSLSNFPFSVIAQPELFSNSDPLKASRIGLNGEIYKFDMTKFVEGSQYAVMSLFDSLFGDAAATRFYTEPPNAFSLQWNGLVAHFVRIEMVGKCIVSLFGKPFYVMTGDHVDAVKAVRDIAKSRSEQFKIPCIDFKAEGNGGEWTMQENSSQVIWTSSGVEPAALGLSGTEIDEWIDCKDSPQKCFMKIIPGCNSDTKFFRNMYRTYKRYEERKLWTTCNSLLGAKLVFGFCQVAVITKWEDGRAWDIDDAKDENLRQQLLNALVVLFKAGITYVDVRSPNILVRDEKDHKSLYLIDYDEAVCHEKDVEGQECADMWYETYCAY